MLSKKMAVADLFAFYGELLTDKQKDVLTLYCLDDLSLGEIADDLGISRQGVHDKVKRATAILMDYENKLGLMEKFKMNNSLLNDINQKMVELEVMINKPSLTTEALRENVSEIIKVVREDIDHIIE